MQNKKSIYKISGIMVLLVFIFGFILTGCTTQNKTAGKTTTPQTETTVVPAETQSTLQLSEQPNKAKYDEYFTEFYLAKLPLGTELSASNLPVKTAVFITSKDQFASVMSVKKDISAGSMSGAIYDTVAKKDFEAKTAFPMALKASNYTGSQPLKYPPGKYEYKVYVDDVLVVNIPFEVR